MLKQAIDAYNFLLDIADLIKKPSRKIKSFILAAFALVLAACSLWSAQAIGGASAAEQLAKLGIDSQALPLSQDSGTAEKQVATSKGDAADSRATDKTDDSDIAERKKAVNSDSRAGVSGEPAAAKSFRLPITKNSQYSAATVIAYDAIKDERIFYGGDLVFGSSSISISKSNPTVAHPLTVTTADGVTIAVPTEPVDDNLPNVAIGLDTTQSNDSSTSYNMAVETSDQLEVGTYQMHIIAGRTGQASGVWQYHGFITITVTD